jgi:hypothetical protein
LADAKAVLADAKAVLADASVITVSQHASCQTGGVRGLALGKLTHYRFFGQNCQRAIRVCAGRSQQNPQTTTSARAVFEQTKPILSKAFIIMCIEATFVAGIIKVAMLVDAAG